MPFSTIRIVLSSGTAETDSKIADSNSNSAFNFKKVSIDSNSAFNFNKAGYTARPVASCWAGAVMQIFRLEYQKKGDRRTEGPMDRRTDGPTDRHSDL